MSLNTNLLYKTHRPSGVIDPSSHEAGGGADATDQVCDRARGGRPVEVDADVSSSSAKLTADGRGRVRPGGTKP